MSQRLTETNNWPYSIPADRITDPLGYRKDGRPILFIGGASPEGDPATGNGGEGGNDGGSGSGGDGSGSGSGTGTGSEGQKQGGEGGEGASGATVSRAEYDALMNRMKAADKRASDLETWKQNKEREGLDEVERLKAEATDKDKLLESANSSMESLRLENAFLISNTYTWHSPAAALKLLDRTGLEVKDGEVKGMDAALKKLAEDHPYLLKEAPKGEGEGGKGDGDKKDPPAGQSKNNGDKRGADKGKFSEEDLRKRYPALNR